MVLSGPVLVTGGQGQVAQALLRLAGGRDFRLVGRPLFDFERPAAIVPLLEAVRPGLVVNAAAYTAVDLAEKEPEVAARANASGPGLIAGYCAAAGIPLIHISTDYVFDGAKGAPYVETDATHPTGVYGASKLAGEAAVLASGARAIILRTSWVYAPRGKNFMLTMLNAAQRTDQLRVVADQRGCPTAAGDLAQVILRLVDRLAEMGWSDGYGGVFHAAGSGWTTWHGFATAIFAEAARFGRQAPTVTPITMAEYPTPARRPADSRLDCDRLGRVFGMALPAWRNGLSRQITELFNAS